MTDRGKEVLKGLFAIIVGIIVIVYNINITYGIQVTIIVLGATTFIAGAIFVGDNSIKSIKESHGSINKRRLGWLLLTISIMLFGFAGYMHNLPTGINAIGISVIVIGIGKFLPD